MNSVKSLALLFSIVLLSSCSFSSKKSDPVVTVESVIAQDFVNTMVQIDALMPWSTVLHFNSSESGDLKNATLSDRTTRAFGRALQVAATNSGYAVQMVDGVRGANFVRFSVSEANDPATGKSRTYDVSVGDVDFRREYRPLTNGQVKPHEAMLVRGADVSDVEPDDSIFNNQPIGKTHLPLMADNETSAPAVEKREGFDSPVARLDEERRLANEIQNLSTEVAVTSPTTDLPKALIERPASPATPEATQPGLPEEFAIASVREDRRYLDNSGFSIVAKQNLAESGTSNYDGLLATKKNVAEEILIFGDDSYVLGARNKKILNGIMSSFDPATDVIQVVGCSTGTTKIANGNAALAIGRANRVKEALLYSGIAHDKIFDEGCWSPTANSTPFPNRGVVVTVKRGVKNG